MEVKLWSYQDIPEYPIDEAPEGVKFIDTTGDEISARYVPDVEYVTQGGVKLKLQVLIPRSRNLPYAPLIAPPPAFLELDPIPSTATKEEKPLPCVVHVQGSAWFEQDVYGNVPMVANLVKRGYVVAIVQYRHSGIAPYPAPIVDARNAVRFLRKNAETFWIDPDRMFISGDSSGGHTSMMAGIRHNDDNMDENAYPGISAEVKAIVNFYGSVSTQFEDGFPTTINHHMPESPEGREMGSVNLHEHPELGRELSVECHIDNDTDIVPVLMFHGTKDRTVNTIQSVNLYNRLKECGKEADLYLLKGADHGGPEFWTDTVIDIVDEFYKKHM